MYPDNVPESGPITTTTWITGVSDILPDSGFFQGAEINTALGWWQPQSQLFSVSGCFGQQLHRSGLRMAESILAESLFCSEEGGV